jgi:hypothetical protein
MGGLLMTKTVRTEQVLRILQGYRCSRWSYDDTGKAMQLTDVLTPNGHETITAGIAELENLADYIAGQLAELPDEPPAPQICHWRCCTKPMAPGDSYLCAEHRALFGPALNRSVTPEEKS